MKQLYHNKHNGDKVELQIMKKNVRFSVHQDSNGFSFVVSKEVFLEMMFG